MTPSDPTTQRKNVILLTGATGLLGRFLMRDLLSKGFPLAVLVRPSPRRRAAERIVDILSKGLPTPFPSARTPVVIEGTLDGAAGRIAVRDADREWIKAHVAAVVNSAASLEFEHSLRSDEPFRTNVEGTRALIDFCRSADVGAFHHVSTAYVCGDRRGVMLESDVDCGQMSRNAYEQSKLAAELVVTASRNSFDTVTIYRPSIIVGDFAWGFTTTFHGFYLPLKILHALLPQTSVRTEAAQFWSALGMVATDGKNLVPVDWVSAAITRIVGDPDLHDLTYHLTNGRSTPVGLIGDVFAEALSDGPQGDGGHRQASPLFDVFTEQMAPYRAYWGDDPSFDRKNFETALPDLPAPVLSRRTLLRLARFALDHQFTLTH